MENEEEHIMKKHFLSLSIASVIALTGSMPAYADDCVEVQSRFAIANCMVESAVAIAAAAASDNGCAAGAWDIEAIVPELYLATIPVQGLTNVYMEGGIEAGEAPIYVLNGNTSAQLKNNVNCSVKTEASGNTFDGKELIYATGSDNYYVDALISQDSPTICISSSMSSGDIGLGANDYDESNSLTFSLDEDGEIEANGLLTILTSQVGGGGQGQGPGGGSQDPEVISAWQVEEEVTIPEELGTKLLDAFEMEAESDDIDGVAKCVIKVEGSVENLVSYIIENETGGLTISGTLSVEQENDEVEED